MENQNQQLVFSMREFLLPSLNLESVNKINEAIYSNSVVFISIMLMVTILWEHLSGSDQTYMNLMKRLILLMFFSLMGHHILVGGVDITLNIADYLVKKFSTGSEFLKMFTHQKENYWFTVMKNIGNSIVNPLMSIIWLLCWIAIYCIGHVFTLVYKLSYIAIPLSCLLSIFPPTQEAVWGIIKSICWCIITPIVSALVLVIIGVENFNPNNIEATFFSLIQTLMYSLTIFWIPALATMFLTTKGFQSAGEKFSSTAGASAMTLGKYHLLKFGVRAPLKGMNFALGRPAMNLLSSNNSPVMDKIKSSKIVDLWKDPKAKKPSSPRSSFNDKSSEPSFQKEEFRNSPRNFPVTFNEQNKQLQSRTKSFESNNLADKKFTIPKHDIDPAYGVIKKSSSDSAIKLDEKRKEKELLQKTFSHKIASTPTSLKSTTDRPSKESFSKINYPSANTRAELPPSKTLSNSLNRKRGFRNPEYNETKNNHERTRSLNKFKYNNTQPAKHQG